MNCNKIPEYNPDKEFLKFLKKKPLNCSQIKFRMSTSYLETNISDDLQLFGKKYSKENVTN